LSRREKRAWKKSLNPKAPSKSSIVSVRLTAYDVALARKLAKKFTKRSLSALLRHAFLKFLEENKNVIRE